MYLKSIDIAGYKSFAQKTHIDLGPGITGIIGPNGCGKSNVMESVRWCLGEMSWKSLRADAMIDVIFAGTTKRPAMSMTEVTLTFDNSQSSLPVQFSEVTVTRRIYRSGESAYFLNKTQCRLRDIREMFLDTGLGGDGYAIIDQGGVDAMITAKPEERRAFFEEAAGVAKYNAKRDEAIRKLERLDMDLGRLQDSLSLIDEQVKKLDSDARKAKLFEKYKAELAAAEAASIIQQAGDIDQQLAVLGEQSKPLEELLGTKRAEQDGEGANLAAANLEKANEQNRVIECNQKISQVKSEIGRLEERVNSSQRETAQIAVRVRECEIEIDQTQARQAAIAPELERASAAVAEAETARDGGQAEVDAGKARHDEQTALLKEEDSRLDALRKEALAAAEDALGRRRTLAEAESAFSREEMRLRASLRDLEKDLAQAARAEEESAVSRELSRTQRESAAAAAAQAVAAEDALASVRAALTQAADDTIRLNSELAQTQARAEALEAQGGQNPYWTGAQAALSAGIPGVIGTVRQLIKCDESVKPYLEDLLGERLYAVVCEDSTAARAAVELLSDSGKGRARFLVLSALPQNFGEKIYPAEAKSLLSQIEIADAKHEAVVRFLLQEAYTLGKALFGEHWVYGGAKTGESLQVGLAEIGELRAKVAVSREKSEVLAADRAALQERAAAAENEARRAGSEAARQDAQASAAASAVAQKESFIETSRRNVELSTSEAAGTLAEMALIKEKIKLLRGGIDEAAAAELAARAREAEAAAGIAALREQVAKSQAEQQFLREKFAGLDEKLRFLAGAYERLGAEKQTLEDAASRRRQEIVELGKRDEQAKAIAEESRASLSGFGERLAGLENDAKAVFDKLQELDRAIAAREAKLRELKALVEESQRKLHELELQTSSQRATRDALTKRLWDDWQLTVDEAKHKYGEQPVDAERVEFLRKRIAALGNVNMAAPEEYHALSEKQVFLANQIEDLKKAKEDLMAAITKINSATRENFRQTFTEVREHFRRLYGVLFEGGEADLVLTEPENILETGVDIVAQPPGKRLQSISLLSGGEKTLTAIALLFSFFMVKPSPFCMLDEADAALDDANVERFVGLLKEFQQRSQFLIVSHNKRTMEAADVIYGVTMEEMGVSQLVSVDFRPNEKRKETAGAAAVPLSAVVPDAEAPKKPDTHGPFELAGETEKPAA